MLSRNSFRFLVIVALAILVIPLAITTPGAYADGDDNQFTPPEKTELKYPNLGSMLNQMVARVEEGESSAQDAASDAPVNQGASVAVTIHLSGNVDDVVGFLEDNGGDPRNVGEDYIEAYVPVSLLGQVSEQPGVIRVRAITPPEDQYGNFTSQGVQVHGSPAWNQAGYSGQGVKVGVIDGGLDFKSFGDLMGTELPTTVEARCYPEIGRVTADLADCAGPLAGEHDHGTRVAETVVDIAPEVSLYIASPSSPADRIDSVEWMVSQGVSIIVRSESNHFDGPGDGTSPYPNSPLKAVDRAVDGGIIWVNSAGNDAQNTWFGAYSDVDGDGAIDFNGSDEVNEVSLSAGQKIRVRLRWDDRWRGATRDLNLYITDNAGRPIHGSEDLQAGGAGDDPYESLSYEVLADGRYGVAIVHANGSAPDWIQLVVKDVDIEHYTENGSIGNPAESANPGMLAVGAAPWYDVNTIEQYSSRGPTPDDRVKPDIVGADCGETALSPLNERNRGFCGTSQAAPHVAGLAALVKQRFPEYTPQQVANYLKDNAEERGVAGPDNTWGHGFAQMPTPTGDCRIPVSQDETISGEWASDCASTTNPRRSYARFYTFTLTQDSDVTIDLESTQDTVLYLLQGAVINGEVIDSNDDVDNRNTDSRISKALTAGTYTIEATTFEAGQTGSFTLTISGLGTGATTPPPSSDREALVALYNATNGSNWVSKDNWLSSSPLDQWDGVSTDSSGRVTELLLLGNQLTGRIPPELGNLSNLVMLYLAENQLTGPIPPELGNLSNLAGLSLSDNQLTGPIPPELGNLSNLAIAKLNGNQLNGPIPPELGNLSNLSGLYLDENQLTGPIPPELGNLSNLTRLYLNGNQLTGCIPAGLRDVPENDLDLLGLPFCGATPPPAADCGETVTGDKTIAGEWASGCDSEAPGRGHARYYSFTLAQESDVTITLESDIDPYLYLRAEDTRSGTALHENDDHDGSFIKSQIEPTLAAGTYTIEATTFDEGKMGSFTLTISGLGASTTPPPPPPTDPCVETVSGDGAIAGTWASGCDSETPGRGYARYYSFTLAQQSVVTVTLESDIDPYLYLRERDAKSGTALHENDDHEGSFIKSQIQQTLAAGTYTIEATTFDEGKTGSFTLTISGLGASTTPPQSCSVGQTLAPGDGCNHQDFSIEINSSGTAIMRFTGTSIDFADLSLTRSGNSWNIESLP